MGLLDELNPITHIENLWEGAKDVGSSIWEGVENVGSSVGDFFEDISGDNAQEAAHKLEATIKAGMELYDNKMRFAQEVLDAAYGSGISTYAQAVNESKAALMSGQSTTFDLLNAAYFQSYQQLAAGGNEASQQYARGMNQAMAQAGMAGARADEAIYGGYQGAQDAMNKSLAGIEKTIGDTHTYGIGYLNRGFGQARQDVQGASQRALSGIDSGYAQAQQTTLRQLDEINRLTDVSKELGALERGARAGLGETALYAKTGAAAAQNEADLLGLNGPEAQQAALDAIQESPAQQFMRDRTYDALLSNAAATGGLGGSNAQEALMEKASGYAAMDYENQLANVRDLSYRGQSIANDRSNLLFNTGSQQAGIMGTGRSQALSGTLGTLGQLAQLQTDQANAKASIEQATGQSLSSLAAQLGTSEADLSLQLGILYSNLQSQYGLQGAQLNQAMGQAAADARLQAGFQQAAISQAGYGNLAQTGQNTQNMLANLTSGAGTDMANVSNLYANNLANSIYQGGSGLAGLQIGQGVSNADLQSQWGANMYNMMTDQGSAQASATMAGVNASNQLLGIGLNLGGMALGGMFGGAGSTGIGYGTGALSGISGGQTSQLPQNYYQYY